MPRIKKIRGNKMIKKIILALLFLIIVSTAAACVCASDVNEDRVDNLGLDEIKELSDRPQISIDDNLNEHRVNDEIQTLEGDPSPDIILNDEIPTKEIRADDTIRPNKEIRADDTLVPNKEIRIDIRPTKELAKPNIIQSADKTIKPAKEIRKEIRVDKIIRPTKELAKPNIIQLTKSIRPTKLIKPNIIQLRDKSIRPTIVYGKSLSDATGFSKVSPITHQLKGSISMPINQPSKPLW